MIIKKKIWPKYFDLVKSGKKRFEIRVADFNAKEDDTLVLEEWNPKIQKYTGRKLKKKIKYVLKFKLDDFKQKELIKKRGLYVIQL